MTTRRIFDSGFSTSAPSKYLKNARDARVGKSLVRQKVKIDVRKHGPMPPNKNKILFGATSDLLDNTLRKIPLVGEIVSVIDGIFSFFGGSNPAEMLAQVRQRIEQEADCFIQTFNKLIVSVDNVGDLEAVTRHVNKAASSITDQMVIQRIVLRLQGTMAEKALEISINAKKAIGKEMQASIDALEERKDQVARSGERAVQDAMDIGKQELKALADQGQSILDDKIDGVKGMSDVVSSYISRLDALRDKVVAAAQKNADGLGDLAATSRSTEFSKRSSSVSARRGRRGMGTTTVVRPPEGQGPKPQAPKKR